MTTDEDDFEEARPVRRQRKSPASDSLPTLVVVMAIIDIGLCLGKVLTGAGNFFMVLAAQQAPRLAPLVPMAVTCGILDLLIFLVGLPAAIGILLKKPWGRLLGWVTAALTVVSIVANTYLGYQNGGIQAQNVNPGVDPSIVATANLVGMVVGVAFRGVLLVLYGLALAQFGKWLEVRAARLDD